MIACTFSEYVSTFLALFLGVSFGVVGVYACIVKIADMATRRK